MLGMKSHLGAHDNSTCAVFDIASHAEWLLRVGGVQKPGEKVYESDNFRPTHDGWMLSTNAEFFNSHYDEIFAVPRSRSKR